MKVHTENGIAKLEVEHKRDIMRYDGVNVLFEYEGGWLVYEYTGFLKRVYPAKRAWIGHECEDHGRYSSLCGFVNAQADPGSNDCYWCDSVIPDEMHGIVALYNYGQEADHDNKS